MKADLRIKGGRVVFPGFGIRRLDVLIHNGLLHSLIPPDDALDAERTLDASNKLVLPGIVDAHTHLTMGPGHMGYETETRSAAMGGVTSVLSYVMDSGDLQAMIETEMAAARGHACVDYGLHPGIVTKDQLDKMAAVKTERGVVSFKFFMTAKADELAYMGVPGNDDGFLLKLLRNVSALPGVIPCVHAENIELVWLLRPEIEQNGDGSLRDWERSRPDYVEAEATSRVLYFAEKADAVIYIVHVTCREALDAVRRAQRRRPGKVFAETCCHYLTTTTENAPSPAGKVNPPLRYADDVEALWEGIVDGTIDVVGSDHVPRRLEFKQGDIWKASAGFPGTATLLPLFLTEGVQRGLPLHGLLQKITTAPAAIFGLVPVKGSLLPGASADAVIVDPNRTEAISAAQLKSDAGYTIYEGMEAGYVPTHTIAGGRVIVEEGRYVGTPGQGQYLHRKPAEFPVRL